MGNDSFIMNNSKYLIDLSVLTDAIWELSSVGTIGRATELKLLEIAYKNRIEKESVFEKNPFQNRVLLKIQIENYKILKNQDNTNLYELLDSIIFLSECLKFLYLRLESEKNHLIDIVTVNSRDEIIIDFLVSKINRYLDSIDKFRDITIKLTNCVTSNDMLEYISKQGIK